MKTEGLNIILQLVEALIFFDFYESIKPSNQKVKNFLLIVFGYLVMSLTNLYFNYNVIINLIVILIFQWLFYRFLYKSKNTFAFLYALLSVCLVFIMENVTLEIVSVIQNTSLDEILLNQYSYILIILFSKTSLLASLKVISALLNKFQLNEKIRITILIYPFSLLFILLDFFLVSTQTNPPDNIRGLLAISSFALVFVVIFTCTLQQKESQKEKELFELRAYQEEQRLNTTYFELLEHQNDELQLFVHDTKKHYNNLYDLAENPNELKNYIKNIVSDLDETNQIGKTSNKLLDLIINKYNYICEKNKISFEKNIHQSNLNFINDNDLTSIFNNLFDNAIEAASKSRKKEIYFGLNKVRDMIIINIKNSCDTPPAIKNQKLISTKADSKLHGYGFKSIQRAVKKHNGDIEWRYDETQKEFSVSIIFLLD